VDVFIVACLHHCDSVTTKCCLSHSKEYCFVLQLRVLVKPGLPHVELTYAVKRKI
jgi:hypothetical protein